jgi:hypothetical protein
VIRSAPNFAGILKGRELTYFKIIYSFHEIFFKILVPLFFAKWLNFFSETDRKRTKLCRDTERTRINLFYHISLSVFYKIFFEIFFFWFSGSPPEPDFRHSDNFIAYNGLYKVDCWRNWKCLNCLSTPNGLGLGTIE